MAARHRGAARVLPVVSGFPALLLLLWPCSAEEAAALESPLVMLESIFSSSAPASSAPSARTLPPPTPAGGGAGPQGGRAGADLPLSGFADAPEEVLQENSTIREDPQAAPMDVGDLFDEMRFSVIRIQSVVSMTDIFRPYVKPGDQMSVGSGFAVKEDSDPNPVFLTNAHVVRDAHSVQVQLPAVGETFFEAFVPVICSELDLAVVQLKKPEAFAAELAARNVSLRPIVVEKTPVHMGMEVAAIGFPLGSRSLKLSRGIISGTEQVDRSICYQSTAPISPGNSGGPLLSVEGGHIVGVNFASSARDDAQNINFVVPALHLAQMLQEFRRKPVSPRADAGDSSMGALPQLRGSATGAAGSEIAAQDKMSAGSNATAGAGVSASRHTIMQLAPIDVLSLESNDALYNASGGCRTGVFLSEIPKWSALRFAYPPVPQRSFLVSVDNSTLDSYGMGYAPGFLSDPIPFESLFQLRGDVDAPVTLTTCRGGRETKHHMSMRWRPEYKLGVHVVDEPHFTPEELDFECFAGLTVMQMSLNHVTTLLNEGYPLTLGRWMLPENQVKPRLMVTHITKGSYAGRVLAPGMVVRRLNGESVLTLNDFRKNFVPRNKDVWTLETDRGLLYAADFPKEVERQVKEASASVSSRYLLTQAAQAAAEGLGLAGFVVAAPQQVNASAKVDARAMRAAVADAKKAVRALERAANASSSGAKEAALGSAAQAAQLASASAALGSAAQAVATMNAAKPANH